MRRVHVSLAAEMGAGAVMEEARPTVWVGDADGQAAAEAMAGHLLHAGGAADLEALDLGDSGGDMAHDAMSELFLAAGRLPATRATGWPSTRSVGCASRSPARCRPSGSIVRPGSASPTCARPLVAGHAAGDEETTRDSARNLRDHLRLLV
jgi:hypothetical protein